MGVKWAPIDSVDYLDLLRVPFLAARARGGDSDAQGELQEIAWWYLRTQILPSLARASGRTKSDLRKVQRLARSSAEMEIPHLVNTYSTKDFKREVYRWGTELWTQVISSEPCLSSEDFKRFEAADREYFNVVYKIAKVPFSFCSQTVRRVRSLVVHALSADSK